MDTGALWENFLISERHKFLVNKDIEAQRYFWRTTQQQEIDYIEELDSRLFAFEFKWNPARKPFLSKTFANAYPLSEFQVISPENLHLFLTETPKKVIR
jgi:predicted AAA+ superfamily ATPase